MNTTETDRVQNTVPKRYPTLKLLYSAGLISRTLSLRPDKTVLGRDVADGDGLSLPTDKQASRHHAAVELLALQVGNAEATLRIVDLNSKNGLFVNGERVESSELFDGDVIRIGNSLLLLRIEPTEIAQESVRELVGQSPAMRSLHTKLAKAARLQSPVLLVGETGTGKDASAQALHSLSSRKHNPLVHVNTSAIPESLAEGQLFGHHKGAFTGANNDFAGLFRQAHGGTLFLNEIGDMPLPLQAKLLSAIERKEVLPVGGSRPVPCDTWFVAATNHNLRRLVRRGLFREDLLERLKGSFIELPPLRSRQEDILLILQYALAKRGVSRELDLTARLVEALLLYHWPGNVRELLHLAEAVTPEAAEGIKLDLIHVQERLFQGAEELDQEAEPGDSAVPPSGTVPTADSPASQDRQLVPRLSAEALARLWDESGHNVSQFAAKVQRSRRQAKRWLAELGLAKK